MATKIFPRTITIVSRSIEKSYMNGKQISGTGVEFRYKALGPSSALSNVKRTFSYAINTEDYEADVETIEAFFDSVCGSYEAFFLPSFNIDQLSVGVTPSSSTIDVLDSSCFSDTQNDYGNWIVIYDTSSGNIEVRRITNIAAAFPNMRLTLNSALTNHPYPSGSYVEICSLVRFSQDTFGKNSFRKGWWSISSSSLEFVEVNEYGMVVL